MIWMFPAMLAQDPATLIDSSVKLLEYGIAGILVLSLILWFIERQWSSKRFEAALKESAKADLEVAKALQACVTILTIHGWKIDDSNEGD